MNDLSEKHLAWFTFMPLTGNSGKFTSQAGEGMYIGVTDDMNPVELSQKVYNNGGQYSLATTMFSSGTGPTSEEKFPYQPTVENEGYLTAEISFLHVSESIDENIENLTFLDTVIVKADEKEQFEAELAAKHPDAEVVDSKTMNNALLSPSEEDIGKDYISADYSEAEGDWTLDEAYRFDSDYELRDGNLLPAPYTVSDELEYVYNPIATAAIKSELVSGRGVSVAFCADQSQPTTPCA